MTTASGCSRLLCYCKHSGLCLNPLKRVHQCVHPVAFCVLEFSEPSVHHMFNIRLHRLDSKIDVHKKQDPYPTPRKKLLKTADHYFEKVYNFYKYIVQKWCWDFDHHPDKWPKSLFVFYLKSLLTSIHFPVYCVYIYSLSSYHYCYPVGFVFIFSINASGCKNKLMSTKCGFIWIPSNRGEIFLT